MLLGQQVANLFLIAIPIACISWSITHEELFREPREFCIRCSKDSRSAIVRKFFYLFTCEYCFSHYVTIAFLFITGFQMIYTDWRGYLISGFSLVWIANIYMSLYSLIRLDIKREKLENTIKEEEIKS